MSFLDAIKNTDKESIRKVVELLENIEEADEREFDYPFDNSSRLDVEPIYDDAEPNPNDDHRFAACCIAEIEERDETWIAASNITASMQIDHTHGFKIRVGAGTDPVSNSCFFSFHSLLDAMIADICEFDQICGEHRDDIIATGKAQVTRWTKLRLAEYFREQAERLEAEANSVEA